MVRAFIFLFSVLGAAAQDIPATATPAPAPSSVPPALLDPWAQPAQPSIATEKAAEILKANFSSVVLIEGDEGAGTGFILKTGEKTYLYTAAHVLCGNTRLTVKTSDGRQLTKFGEFQAASDADLCRVEILEECESGLTAARLNAAQVRDPLLAIGNSGGAGVLTVLEGQIVSLGPDQLEVSAGVIQGNSGGPVFSGHDGQVLGVVTHLIAAREDIWAKDTEFAEIRRFATRLDRTIAWETMPIGRFLGEKKILDDFNQKSRLLYAFSRLDPGQAGLRLDVRVSETGPTLLSIIQESEDLPIVQQLYEMNVRLADKRLRTSETDLRRRFGAFYADALRVLDRREEYFAAHTFSGYNRPSAEQALTWRAEAAAELRRAADGIR